MAEPLPCICPCHEHPGTYPTSAERPCSHCGHVNAEGQMLGTLRDGWTSNLTIHLRPGLALRREIGGLLEQLDIEQLTAIRAFARSFAAEKP